MRNFSRTAGAVLLFAYFCALSGAQGRLQTLPRYDRFDRLRREAPGSVPSIDLRPSWDANSKTLYYSKGGKSYAFDLSTRRIFEGNPPAPEPVQATRAYRGGNPERGRQNSTETSLDGKYKAYQKDRNVFISNTDGTAPVAVTTDGSVSNRIKNGVASWVYGEELGVRDAMWWSPDSSMLAYYRFDESKVKDYYLALNQLAIQSTVDIEPYPKAGADNPRVDLYVYDLASKKSKAMDVHFDGGSGPDVGTYVYNVRWSPDGKELLFNRTNRRQNVMEFCAANPKTGACRVIIRESSPTWTDNSPEIVFLAEDKPGPKRFLWRSERTGFYNYFLYDLSGKLYNQVTKNNFEAAQLVRVEPAKGVLYYMGRDGDDPYLLQLHRAKLDGSSDQRLTDPKFNHSVSLSPDGLYFVDMAETLDTPPVARLIGPDGKPMEVLAQADLTKFNQLSLKRAERFTFTAGDGQTTCYGVLYKPSDFDPTKRYPVIVSVYGGPDSGAMGFYGAERFQIPPAYTELGFIVATIDGRGTSGRGKAFKDAVYGKLGVVEIDDQAAGAAALAQRSYVNPNAIGIFGTSYGGYASVMAILRHPEVFSVAIACSSVTDWRNYDSVYTERYMGLPWASENQKGYDLGSAMKYAGNLKGKLLLYYGSADNNVHPSNTIQLIQALDDAQKSYDLRVGPDESHTALNFNTMLEYFVDNLILHPR